MMNLLEKRSMVVVTMMMVLALATSVPAVMAQQPEPEVAEPVATAAQVNSATITVA
jgi:hypothetical protein